MGIPIWALEAQLSFRQSRLAEAVEIVLGVLRALEGAQSCLCALNRPCGLDPQDLRGFRSSFFEFPQLGIGSGQAGVAGTEIRRPGAKFSQWRQRLRIL